MKKKNILLMILILSLLLTGCSLPPFISSYLNDDYADYFEFHEEFLERPAGSAKYLEGHTLLVSIYMDSDANSSVGWDNEDVSITQNYLDMACDYLVEEGREYGQEVELTYDIYQHEDLVYFTDMDVFTEEDDNEEIDDSTYNWIEDNIDYFSLMEKYDADSVGFIYFMNSGGRSWCFPKYHDPEFEVLGYMERAYIYLYDEYGAEYENPATYAHEILHMFGAIDLYMVCDEDGVTDEVLNYADENYPNDIMYTVYDENGQHLYDHIPYDIGPMTAYFIGFTDSCDELDLFPQLIRENKASFTIIE